MSRLEADVNPIPRPSGSLRPLLVAVLLGLTAIAGSFPSRARAQAAPGWSFENDAFAELWYHGLAVVSFYGFGPIPLYDPGYGLASAAESAAGGLAPTRLEEERVTLLQAFQADEAFEILHFVPVYFQGAGVTSALEALSDVANTASGLPRTRDRAADLGVQVVGQVLARPDQRAVLGRFVQALREEWTSVLAPRLAGSESARSQAVSALAQHWQEAYAGPLHAFLVAEGLSRGHVVLASALGAEGRFVPPSGTLGREAVVAVAMPTDEVTADAVLSSIVRELCYPAVRRAFEPLQARFADRVEASRVSDLAATRCGDLLLEAHAPSRLAAYRSRFGLPSAGTGRAFLSASGVIGAAALEIQLAEALERELNIHRDGARADARTVRRK